ncbi:MAG: succinate dehydrogenase cytochrome b subunit [Thermodesulfobacteriota bacterium]
MNWLVMTFKTSLGKKLLMAVTGMIFLLFLAVHLIGNLTIYGGEAAFNSYVEHLHALGPLLAAAEGLLVLALLVHVTFGTILFFENRKARPVGYAVDKSGGGRTWSSRTMPYTGLLILVFLLIHLGSFSRFFREQTGGSTFSVMAGVFSHKGYLAFYLLAMVVVAFHVRHGLWSAFQTVGASHPKYQPFIERASILFAVIVGVGFGTLPLVIHFLR